MFRISNRAVWWLTATTTGCLFESASFLLQLPSPSAYFPLVSRSLNRQIVRTGPRIAVVLPFTQDEVVHQLDNLERWAAVGAPSDPSTAALTDLVFYYNHGPSNASELDALFRNPRFLKSWASLSSSFSTYRVHYADLNESQDVYPAGPSHMFFNLFLTPAGRQAMSRYKAIFWAEWDVFPVRPGWATKLYEESTTGEPFWIKGSIYLGRTLDDSVQNPSNWGWVSHINGNALYATSDADFRAFLETVIDQEPPGHYWKPFDVSISKVFRSLPYSWQWQQKFSGRFQYVDFIRHLGFTVREEQVQAARNDPNCFLVHGKSSSAGVVRYNEKFSAGRPTASQDVVWTDEVQKELNLSVLIRSFRDDLEFAVVAASSAARYIQNALEIIVVVPTRDLELFKSKVWSPSVQLLGEDDILDNGHLQQKLTKLRADHYCKGDYILHLDSDMIISRPVLKKDLLWLGKPMLPYAPYSELSGWQSAWQQGTSDALGQPVDFEYSRSPAHIYPRGIYAAARQFIETQHGKSLIDFLSTRKGKNLGSLNDPAIVPRLFSDFNFLGAYLFYHARDQMTFIPMSPSMRDEGVYPLVPPFVCQGNARLAAEMQVALSLGSSVEMLARLQAGMETGSCTGIDEYVILLTERATQAADQEEPEPPSDHVEGDVVAGFKGLDLQPNDSPGVMVQFAGDEEGQTEEPGDATSLFPEVSREPPSRSLTADKSRTSAPRRHRTAGSGRVDLHKRRMPDGETEEGQLWRRR